MNSTKAVLFLLVVGLAVASTIAKKAQIVGNDPATWGPPISNNRKGKFFGLFGGIGFGGYYGGYGYGGYPYYGGYGGYGGYYGYPSYGGYGGYWG